MLTTMDELTPRLSVRAQVKVNSFDEAQKLLRLVKESGVLVGLEIDLTMYGSGSGNLVGWIQSAFPCTNFQMSFGEEKHE